MNGQVNRVRWQGGREVGKRCAVGNVRFKVTACKGSVQLCGRCARQAAWGAGVAAVTITKAPGMVGERPHVIYETTAHAEWRTISRRVNHGGITSRKGRDRVKAE